MRRGAIGWQARHAGLRSILIAILFGAIIELVPPAFEARRRRSSSSFLARWREDGWRAMFRPHGASGLLTRALRDGQSAAPPRCGGTINRRGRAARPSCREGIRKMKLEPFWQDLRNEVNTKSLAKHPIYRDLAAGRLKRATLAELCAQLKYTVTDGISSLALIIPQVPRPIRKELAANLFGELHGTPEEPSHWELALRAGAAAGYTEAEIDARTMLAETKLYPDTVSAYAMRGKWLESLSFVALGIEDLFTEFCDGVTRSLKKRYGYSDAEAQYFSAHIAADEAHAETGWEAASTYATTDESKRSVRWAALEGRNMWWNMYSAVYRKGEGKPAPILHLDA